MRSTIRPSVIRDPDHIRHLIRYRMLLNPICRIVRVSNGCSAGALPERLAQTMTE
jgi:hypothetical protein